MATPLISIITPVYNGAEYLPALIDSVLMQDYPHYEHIIVNDGSDDDGATEAVLSRYPHLRWWGRENKGAYPSINEGLQAAQGEIVVVINADDAFATPDAFSRVVAVWSDAVDLVYSPTQRIDDHGAILPYGDLLLLRNRWMLRHYLYIQHCSLFVRRSVLTEHALWWDTTFKYTGDWDWILRLYDVARETRYIRPALASFRMHLGQTSRRDKTEAIQAEHRRICQRYGSSYRLHHAIQVLVNYRAMGLLALDILRRQGAGALVQRGQAWMKRKVAG
ncbi:MAG: hypothetical protein OHK0046_09550 [Anaerolineae bacterium]